MTDTWLWTYDEQDPVLGHRTRVVDTWTAIAWTDRRTSLHIMSDDAERLLDFITVHWAWPFGVAEWDHEVAELGDSVDWAREYYE